MSRLRQVFVIVTVWVVTTAGLCDFTPPPPQGQNVIPVDFSYQQTTYWCIPATIQMVTRWVAKREVATQAQIWSYSLSAYPADLPPLNRHA